MTLAGCVVAQHTEGVSSGPSRAAETEQTSHNLSEPVLGGGTRFSQLLKAEAGCAFS